MATGIVKWFNSDKGFGFILPDDGGRDVFVHKTALKATGLSALQETQRVSFDLAADAGKGPRAVNIALSR